jgi:hypothetical protein
MACCPVSSLSAVVIYAQEITADLIREVYG